MEALHRMPGGDVIPPFSFVLQILRPPFHTFVGRRRGSGPRDSAGRGDPLMPALFALGQHQALVAVQETLQPSERLLAFLDDVYVASVPGRIATVESFEDKFWRHTRISINQGKFKCGTGPERHLLIASTLSLMQMVSQVVCRAETTIFPLTSRASPFSALHWGTWTSCKDSLMKKLKRTWSSSGQNLQSPRSPVFLALTLVVRRFPSKSRSPGCQSCVVLPIRADARRWDQGVLHMWEMASLPFALGGLCLRKAERVRSTAHWASWADTLPVIRARHPDVADHMLVSLSNRCGWVPLGGSQRVQRSPCCSWC